MINKCEAIFRWNEATEQWRMLVKDEDGELKFREFFDCAWVKMFFRNRLMKSQDNIVDITVEIK